MFSLNAALTFHKSSFDKCSSNSSGEIEKRGDSVGGSYRGNETGC
jgi:hypothetical protein